jgi:hypothetical protein
VVVQPDGGLMVRRPPHLRGHRTSQNLLVSLYVANGSGQSCGSQGPLAGGQLSRLADRSFGADLGQVLDLQGVRRVVILLIPPWVDGRERCDGLRLVLIEVALWYCPCLPYGSNKFLPLDPDGNASPFS